MPELEVRDLTKRFGKTVAVDDLSFSVEAGQVTGFLGPNGAGKTTTMRALLGLVRPSAGEALVEGHPPVAMKELLRTVGAALEATAFHPSRSGSFNHLRVLAASAGIPRSRVEEVLEMVELSGAANRRVKGYSLGMRQRLALAAALLGGVVASFALLGALRLGVGAIVRNQVGAIIAAFAFFFVLSTLPELLPGDIGDYFPAQAVGSLHGLPDEGLSQATGGLVLAAWSAGLVLLGTLLIRHRDLNE